MARLTHRTKRALGTAAFISINLACLWVYYHYSQLQDDGPGFSSVLAYGASAAPLLSLIEAHNLTSEGPWKLVLYFGDETRRRAIPNAKYAQVLHDRFHDRGLGVIGIVAGSFPEAEELAERRLISYPLIRDTDLDIAQALGLPPRLDGCFFVDNGNTVQFSTSSLYDPEDLRQLTEKFLLGEVTYPEVNTETSLREGEPLPEFTLLRVANFEPVRPGPSETATVIIIFTAACASCRLSGYLNDYARIESHLTRKPIVIFSQNFSHDEILIETRNRGLDPSNFYLASGALPGIEDSYYWSPVIGLEVLVIRTDQTGTIKRMETWEEFTARLEGEESS